MGVDIVLLVPFQPLTGSVQDAPARRTVGAHVQLPLLEARSELEAHLGDSLPSLARARLTSLGTEVRPAHRSLTAVALATHLERAGLRWRVVDPGAVELAHWRRALEELRAQRPLAIGISTTFLTSQPWMASLVRLVRRILPASKLLVGGYYYATSAKDFLALDADVLCVGEGETRLPDIVRRLRAGAPLDDVPGLYLRTTNGSLRYTGAATALDLEALPLPDWGLAERIDPPVSLRDDYLEVKVETQRGCVFKCEFCTYRTLADLATTSPELACDAIASSAVSKRGWVYLVDATATYPHARWKLVLERIVERGGIPLPIGAYARVSDLTDSRVELMAKAGVRNVFIGQESGDQRILNRMKKATRVAQVRPAAKALSQHGVTAFFSFIHGFPGETAESIRATRSMIAELNDGLSDRPACIFYQISPFSVMDLSTAARAEELAEARHFVDYSTDRYDAVDVAREVLTTIVEVSRVPSAPIAGGVLGWVGLPLGSAAPVEGGPDRLAAFRWLKAVERGATLFVEHRVLGRPLDRCALSRARETILGKRDPRRVTVAALGSRAKARLARVLRSEWSSEAERGPGPLTRVALGAFAWRDTFDVDQTLAALRRAPGPAPTVPRTIEVLATELVEASLARRRLPMAE